MFGKVQEDSFRNIFDLDSYKSESCLSAEPFKFRLDNEPIGSRLAQHLRELQSRSPSQSEKIPLDNDGKRSPASPVGSSKVNTSRYKTELCRPFQENGVCKYGEKCQFAHGSSELRSIPRHPKYKTDLCRTYHSVGFCPYGPRCHFIHNLDEIEQVKKPKLPSNKDASSQQFRPLPMFNPNETSSAPMSPVAVSPAAVSPPPGFPSRSTSTPSPTIRLPVFSTLAKF